MALLEVDNLRTCFRTRKGTAYAVDGVSFSLDAGKTLALVGESGSGKSVTAMSILRLLDENGWIESGGIHFDMGARKADLVRLPMEEMYGIRGDRISMIFQEPMTALNPVFTVGKQLCEPFLIHRNMTKKQARENALSILKSVKISNAEWVMKEYPHRLSGGMRQRVMIAMALACQPDILIADEPTTALDVTIQAQILRLMKELQAQQKTAVLFITHDLGVVREVAGEVAVMYCGQVIERVPAPVLFGDSSLKHPYTEGLLASAPSAKNIGARLKSIPGQVPSPYALPKGCRFAPRCQYATKKCWDEMPDLAEIAPDRYIRCFYPSEEERNGEKHQRLVVRNRP